MKMVYVSLSLFVPNTIHASFMMSVDAKVVLRRQRAESARNMSLHRHGSSFQANNGKASQLT